MPGSNMKAEVIRDGTPVPGSSKQQVCCVAGMGSCPPCIAQTVLAGVGPGEGVQQRELDKNEFKEKLDSKTKPFLANDFEPFWAEKKGSKVW